MQREIIFRGLTTDNKGFVYGSLIRRENIDLIGYYVITPPTNNDPCGDTVWHEEPVIKKTVGQFSGLKDKNDKKIFEQDILSIYQLSNGTKMLEIIGEVCFYKDRFEVLWEKEQASVSISDMIMKGRTIEIIGNSNQI